MQVRKANRVVLAAAAAVAVSTLTGSAFGQTWQSSNRLFIVSDGEDGVRAYNASGSAINSHQYTIPMTSSATQRGMTWNHDTAGGGIFYVLEGNNIRTFWDSGSSTPIYGPTWSLGYAGLDMTYRSNEIYVTRGNTFIHVYNAITGAAVRTMTVSVASALRGIHVDWTAENTFGNDELILGDQNRNAGGYRLSRTNGVCICSYFHSMQGGLAPTYGSMSSGWSSTQLWRSADAGSGSSWEFVANPSLGHTFSSHNGPNNATSFSSWPGGSIWDQTFTDSTGIRLFSHTSSNQVTMYNTWMYSSNFGGNCTSKTATTSVSSPMGLFYKFHSNPTAPTGNSLISAGFNMGQIIAANPVSTQATIFNGLSGANQITTFNGMSGTAQTTLFNAVSASTQSTLFGGMAATARATFFPTLAVATQANVLPVVAVTEQVTLFTPLVATTRTSVFNTMLATPQMTLFPALATSTRTALFPTLAITSQVNVLPTVAVTEQASLFTPLALTTQTSVFNALAATPQASLFPALSTSTRTTLYPTLDVDTKVVVLPTVLLPEQVTLFSPEAVTTQVSVFSGLTATHQITLFNALGATTQSSLMPSLAESLQLSVFPVINESSQVNTWPSMDASVQSSLFATTPSISALNNVTINNTTSGAGSSPTYTSVINGAQLGVATILSSLANPTTVRGGLGDGNSGEGAMTLAVPLDYDPLGAAGTLSLRATGALTLSEAIFDSNTGTSDSLNLNLSARNGLAVTTGGTPVTTGDMTLGADILLNGGALNSRSFEGATLIDADATIIANGGISMAGASFTHAAGLGSITSSGNTTGNISITATDGDLVLENLLTAAGTSAGNITLTAPSGSEITLGAVDASGLFTVNATGANTAFTGTVAAGSMLVNGDGADLTFDGDLTTGGFTIDGTSGARVLGMDVVVDAAGEVSWVGDSFTQDAGAGSISTTANTTGNISIDAATGDISLLNPISASGTGAGNITIGATAGATITLGEVTGTGTVTVNGADAAGIEFTEAVDAGNFEVDGTAAAALAFNAVTTAGDFNVSADGADPTFDGDLTVGAMSVSGSTGSRTLGMDVVVDATGSVSIEGASISQDAGAGSITSAAGDIELTATDGDVAMGNALTATAGSVIVSAPADASITLDAVAAAGSFVVNGDDTAAITLAGVTAGSTEIYNSGSGDLNLDGDVDGSDLLVAKSGGTANYSAAVTLTGGFTMSGGSHEFASTSSVDADSVTFDSSTSVTLEAPMVANTMDFGGGSLVTSSDLSAGSMSLGSGTFEVLSGAGTVDVGTLDAGGGVAMLRSDASFDTLDLGSGGQFDVRDGAEVTVATSLGTTGSVVVRSGSTLNVDTAVPGNSASISVSGGTLFMAEEPSSGGSGVTFGSGTIRVGTDATYATGNGMARFMGSSLGTGRTVIVDGVLTLDSAYTISGGRLAVEDIANSYFLSQTSGALQLTNADFQVTEAGQFGETLSMSAGRVLEITDTSEGTVAADGTLIMSGGRFVVGAGVTLTNEGDVQFTNSNSRLHGDGTFWNEGIVSGTGRLDVSETINAAGGIIRVSSGNYLRMNTSVLNAADGRIEIQSASADVFYLDNQGLVTMSTSSVFVGKPTLRLGTALPSSNAGDMFISGEADVFGDLTNGSGGVIRIGGGGVVNFFDDIDNADGDEFQVAGGSAAVFFSSFTLGTVTGDGTVVVMGTLIPRSNLGGSSIDGNLTLGETSTTEFSVGADGEFSAIGVGGQAMLDGALVLTETGYRYLGDTYDLFTADNIVGQFDSVVLPEPGWGMNYELRFTGNTVSAVVVPEPATLSALAGLAALSLRRRRH